VSLRESLARNRRLLLGTAAGMARGVRARPGEFRHHVARDAWTVAKRFAAPGVVNIEKREVPCFVEEVVTGYLDDHQRMLLAALARRTGAQTFFEIGTNRGRTTWTVAVNNPGMELFTLDVPGATPSGSLGSDDQRFLIATAECGEAFRGTAEAARITQLLGDSATFDFSPWAGAIDLVYVDGAHTYDYVRSDTRRALDMLSERGTIVWDDYGSNPGVYAWLNELAPTLDRPIFHVFGTRMAFYARTGVVHRLAYDHHASLPTV
jgi:hypothetical protein